MDVELAMDDPAWNFALIGCIDMRLVNATAAIAKFGEGSLMKFIDLVELRDLYLSIDRSLNRR